MKNGRNQRFGWVLLRIWDAIHQNGGKSFTPLKAMKGYPTSTFNLQRVHLQELAAPCIGKRNQRTQRPWIVQLFDGPTEGLV